MKRFLVFCLMMTTLFAEDCCPERCCTTEIYLGGIALGANREVGRSENLDEFLGRRGKTDGILYGALVGLTYRNPCTIYFNAELDWRTGRLKKGKKSHSRFPNRNLNELYSTFKLGYNFAYECVLLTPYLGVGNWYENHRINRTFKHHYCSWFWMAGGRVDWQYHRCFTIGLDAAALIPIHTNVKFRGIKKHITMHRGWGAQIEVPFRVDIMNLCGCYDGLFVTLAPFYRIMEWGHTHCFIFEEERFRASKLELHDYGAKLYAGFCF